MSGVTPEAGPGAGPEANAEAQEHAARVGVAGWIRGLVARASEPDARQAAIVTLVVAVAVFALGARPLQGGFELDLRDGDAVGGWQQITLVGFSIVRPFGRVLPDQPGRSDLRIISNRPLPDRFELVIEAWTLRPGHPVDLEVALGGTSASERFGADAVTRRMSFENASGARVIELVLAPEDKLAVRRISVVESGDGP